MIHSDLLGICFELFPSGSEWMVGTGRNLVPSRATFWWSPLISLSPSDSERFWAVEGWKSVDPPVPKVITGNVAAQDGIASSTSSGFKGTEGAFLAHRYVELLQCRFIFRYCGHVPIHFWGLLSAIWKNNTWTFSPHRRIVSAAMPLTSAVRISLIVTHLDTYFEGEFNTVAFVENGGELVKLRCKYYSTSNPTLSWSYFTTPSPPSPIHI